ncbi:MAG: hypothetical protein COV36_07440 [Alphaproteobacteria bacterium CG11_big_fil_rev_8_21_14_0_20_44_7]|nr:MAG: hypothetical protein COV36_07440 [Alphaproteobacteria bacterium CG11_big_fil_rev_8_21_14_0_20_44_7]
MSSKSNSHEGFIIEFYQLGNALKVSAIDPKTFREVSIVGDPKASQEEMIKVAVKKLQYVLAKE